jgi:hypothetical protein
LSNCTLHDDAGLIITGGKAKVINNQSEIAGTVTGTGVATGYYKIIPTLVQ